MADFVHLRRVYVSQRLTRGRRDFNTAALDFQAQQYLLSKSRVLDPDYAVKVLNPDGERESEKRIPGGHTKPPEIRFDPKATRKPGQILKLHVTAEDMLDDSEKPNFGWVDPPAPVDPFDEIRRLAKKPKISVREYDINPRTGGQDVNNFRDIELKSLGDKIGGGGRSLIGRAARKLGMIVDDLGKFRCPPGTPNANQFTDITGSTCFPSVGRVQSSIETIMRHMSIGWGNNYAHQGIPRDVADRIGFGWSQTEARGLAESSVAEQEAAGVRSAARYGVRSAAQMRRIDKAKKRRVKEIVEEFEIEWAGKEGSAERSDAFIKTIKKLKEEGLWNNGKDAHGDDRPPPRFVIESLSRQDISDMSLEDRENTLTDELLEAAGLLELVEIPESLNFEEVQEAIRRQGSALASLGASGIIDSGLDHDARRAEYDRQKKAGKGDLYEAIEKLREQYHIAVQGASIAFLDLWDQDRRNGTSDVSTIAEFNLGHTFMGTGEITDFVGWRADKGESLEGADPLHTVLKINMLDATFKQYYDQPGNKIANIIASGDAVEGDKWDALHKFMKSQQRITPFMNAMSGGWFEEYDEERDEFVEVYHPGEHGQNTAGAMLRARMAETMQVTYHGFTHVQQMRIFRDRVESKLDSDGKYTIQKPSLYRESKPLYGDAARELEPETMSLYPEEKDLIARDNDGNLLHSGAEVNVAFSHWTNQQLADAVLTEMYAQPDGDFPPGGMPLMKDSMLDLLSGQYVTSIRRHQAQGQRGIIRLPDRDGVMQDTLARPGRSDPGHLVESLSRQSQREQLMYMEATAELNAGRHMGLYGGPVIDKHLSYLDEPAQPVRARHITEGQTLIDDVVHDDEGAVLSPHRLRRVQATADGRPIRTEDRAGPRIDSMHARGVGSRGDGVQIRGLINEEFGFEDGPMDAVDPDRLDGRFQRLLKTLVGLNQDRELSPNEKIRKYLAARGMEQILNENARRGNASDYYKNKLANEGKPVAPGEPFGGRWTDDFTRSLRSNTDQLFDDLGGTRVFQPPSIRETDEALSTHTATRRAIMMGGLSEQQAIAIDADLPAKHRDLTDPKKLAERIRLNAAAARYADDHVIDVSTSPDKPSPHVDREIIEFIAPAMRVMDDNPLSESVTVRVRDENDRGVRQVGDIIKRDFTVGTVSSHARSDREDRQEPGEGASFRIEMPAGYKGVHRENDVLLPPGEFKVTSIDDNGDIVLTPVTQQTGAQVLKNIENALDDMPAPASGEEHQRKMVRSATRRGQVQATVEEPEEIRVLYNAPDQMPLASVHRELNELANRDEQTPLVGREKDRLNELSRFLRMRTTGSSDLPDPDDDEAHVPRVIHVPSTGDLSAIPSDDDWIMVGPNSGLRSQRDGGFRSSRADVDLDENGVHTDSSGIRMTYNRAAGEWQHLGIRRNPARDAQGRSLLQQMTGGRDENGLPIWEDLPLVPNGDGTMFQWDGERWRPDLSQVPEHLFDPEIGLVVAEENGGFRRYDVETGTWSDFSIATRDLLQVPSESRTNWKLNHSGLKVRDSQLGNGTSDDPRDILPPLLTDIMYHGTRHDFEEFEHGRNISGAGAGGGTKNPDSGLGFHFSPFEQTAAGMSAGAFVKTVHLDLRNPAPIADLQHLLGVRRRATISALGLDELFEEMFEAHLEANFPGVVLEGNTPFERLMYADRALKNTTYGEGGLVSAFIEELVRVRNRHHFRDEPRAGSNEYEGRVFNDHKIPNLELILTPEQIEELSPMLFLSHDKVEVPGEGTGNDLLTREWLKGQGYDGLIIKEAWMGPPGGEEANAVGLQNSGDPRQVSYVAFDPEQITTANPPVRTPEQQAYRERALSDIEQGRTMQHDGSNDAFVPFDVEVSVGGEVLFTGGEREPGSGRGGGGRLFESIFWENHGKAAWDRDREQRDPIDFRNEYERAGGLASRRNTELRTSLGEQQERLTENMRARKRTQDEGELAELAEDFEYLAGIERRDRREFNSNNQAGLKSSRGSADRGTRARMRDKDNERQAARIENGVGGATGDIFNPDDTWVEEAIRKLREDHGTPEGDHTPRLGGGHYDWTIGTRDEKVGRALDEARHAIETFRGTEWAIDYGDQRSENFVNIPLPPAVRKLMATSTDEEVLDRLRQAVRQYVSDFDPKIRIAAKRGRAEELLADPDRRAKSTHEVTSQHSGAYERRQLELTWGVPLDAPAEVRPISGYVDHKESRRLKLAWLEARDKDRGSGRANFGNAVDPDFLPDYWADNGISPGGPATWVYGETSTGSIEFVLKADRANDSGVIFGDSAIQGAKRPTTLTSTNADDLLAALLFPETSRSSGENRMHVMSLLNGSLTGDWSGVLDPDVHRRATRNDVSPSQAASVSHRYAEALVPGGFDFEDVEHVSMPTGTFNVPEDLAPGDMGRNHQDLVDALAPFNLSDAELDQLFSEYGSSKAHHYALYMRNYLGMLEKKRELRKLGLETVFPNHDSIDYFNPETWLSLSPAAWGGTKPSPNSNVYELLQHLIRADIIRKSKSLVDDVRRPIPVYDPTVSVV